jgi:hypothetical protein
MQAWPLLLKLKLQQQEQQQQNQQPHGPDAKQESDSNADTAESSAQPPTTSSKIADGASSSSSSSEGSLFAAFPVAAVLHGVATLRARLTAPDKNTSEAAVAEAAGPDGWVANLAAITARAAAVSNCTVLDSAAAAAANEEVAAAWTEHCTSLAALLERNLRLAAPSGDAAKAAAAADAPAARCFSSLEVPRHMQEATEFTTLSLPCLALAASSSQPGGPEQRHLFSLIACGIKLVQQEVSHQQSLGYTRVMSNAVAALELASVSCDVLRSCLGAAAGSSTAADAATLQLPAAAVPWLALVLRCFRLLGQVLRSPLAIAAGTAAIAAAILEADEHQASANTPAGQQLAVGASAATTHATAGQHSLQSDATTAAAPAANLDVDQSLVCEGVLGGHPLLVPGAPPNFCSMSSGLLVARGRESGWHLAGVLEVQCCR